MKVFLGLIILFSASSSFADPLSTEVCVGINSTENVCISKDQTDDNSWSHTVTISDAGLSVTVNSTKTYLGVDPTQLTASMASIFTGGFNASEMAHYRGPIDSELKAVASGVLPSSVLDREANRIAYGLSLHTQP